MSKVILLTSNFPPLEGGISNYLYEIIRKLPSGDVSVICLPTPGWKAFDANQNFEITRLPIPEKWDSWSSKYKWLAPFYCLELVKKSKNVNYVLCGDAHHTLMLPAWLVQSIAKIPYGVFTYGLDLLRPQQRNYKPLFNSLIRSAQLVFSDSRQAGDIAIKIGVRPERINIIHPIVNVDLITKESSHEELRQKLGLQGKRCILTVGRLVERKGHDVVIQALPEILKKVPDAHYVIVGRGPNRPQLEGIVKTLGLTAYVTFVGYVPDDQLISYYALCDVFAMVSREIPEKGDMEGFGIVYLEANLFGKPVVAGRSGGVADAVLDGQTGLMVDPNSSEETASAIISLITDSALANRLGESGKMRTLEEFSGEKTMAKIYSALGLR